MQKKVFGKFEQTTKRLRKTNPCDDDGRMDFFAPGNTTFQQFRIQDLMGFI